MKRSIPRNCRKCGDEQETLNRIISVYTPLAEEEDIFIETTHFGSKYTNTMEQQNEKDRHILETVTAKMKCNRIMAYVNTHI